MTSGTGATRERSDEAAEKAPDADQQPLEESENAGEQSADRPS